MEPKTIFLIIALCAVVLTAIIGSIIYCAFIVGARSEPKEDYSLIITQGEKNNEQTPRAH